MAKVSCPLCLSPHFSDLDALRSSLIAITTTEIQCPVCQEPQRGLDKFTIHLFTHLASTPACEVPLPESSTHSDHTMIEDAPTDLPSGINTPAAKNEQPASILKDSSVANVVAVGIEEEINNVQNELAFEQRTIRCDICNFTFSDENILDMHQKLLHQTLEDKQTGLYSYHCHLCSKKFKMKGSLMVHLRVAHYGFGHSNKTEQDLLSSLQKLKKSQVAKNEEHPKKWSCDVCQKFFTTKYFLKKHKRLHTGEMPYFCAQCNKSFTFQQTYRKHMLYHSSEKPHVCGECGRAFKELSTLHNHERIHSGERPFACENCGKCFRQRVSYLVHKRIHTGVMPYKCAVCGKTFRYKVSQRSHKCTGNNGETKIAATANTQLSPVSPSTSASVPNHSSPNVNIVFNADGQIIEQNFTFDGQNLITFAPNQMAVTPNEQVDKATQAIKMEVEKNRIVNNTGFYSIMNSSMGLQEDPGDVSNEVTTLTAHTSNMSISGDKMTTTSKLQTINEESLKQLLYGAVHL